MKLSKYPGFILIALLFGLVITPCFGKVFYSKEEALKLAFGDDASIETLSLFPSDEQIAQIEQLAKFKLESKLFSFYVGRKQNAIVGYAAIESHTVRTQPETLLILLDAQGKLSHVYTLAFHEPPEYQTPERWLAQLLNHPIDSLSFDKDIQGVAGATLSARAALNSTRKVLAMYQIMLKPANN
jgi:hypothetical protein